MSTLNCSDWALQLLLIKTFVYFFVLTRDAAGQNFQEYSTAHAGIGIWNVDSDIKISIEFL